MADRVAVHRIVVGSGDERKVIQPGERFNTEEAGIDEEQLKRFDTSGAVRQPRDQVEQTGGPRAETRQGMVVEGRSGPVNDAVSQPEQEVEGTGEEQEQPAEEPQPSSTTRRRRSSADEEL